MRRSRTRLALGAALAAALLLSPACRWGPRLERFEPATAPRGATLQVTTAQPGGLWEAELLAVSDSGVLVRTGRPLVFLRWEQVRRGAVEDLGAEYRFGGGRPSGDVVERLRLVSRFPQGVDATLLQRLLAVSGQSGVEAGR